ncbi:MAG TPA: oxalate/formate MFS antiporter [Rhodopila sp.]|nr:oxalate/formate MFS antiporter [Rhodopila sp.]
MVGGATAAGTAVGRGRWLQLWFGVLSMVLIANLQYGWTLFVGPLHGTHGWPLADIQWAFSIFIAMETWLTPIAGMIVDRIGPRLGPRTVVAAGGILVAAGWMTNALADTLTLLYVGAAISGTGAGAIYATCVGNAVKWFPDRRGLAVGLTAGGFGAGAALTVVPIRMTIAGFGYQAAFLWFGAGQGLVLILVAFLLHGPAQPVLAKPAAQVPQSAASLSSAQMVRTPVFWLLYIMFMAISASGLMATAQLAPIAQDFGIANMAVFMGASTLSVALVVDNVLNGLARPFFGAVSDRIGRERTMALAFSLGALSYWLLAVAGRSPWAFIICAGLIFFTWGEIFSLFPSTCTDTFGPDHATANVSLLYTAKGASAFLVPLANLLKAMTGGWEAVFLVAAGINVAVVMLALFVLAPLRARAVQRLRMAAAIR